MLLAAASVVALLWRAVSLDQDGNPGDQVASARLAPLIFAGAGFVAIVVIVWMGQLLSARRLVPRAAAPGLVVVAATACLAALAALPVNIGWQDTDCGEHAASVPAAAAPWLHYSRPRSTRLVYTDLNLNVAFVCGPLKPLRVLPVRPQAANVLVIEVGSRSRSGRRRPVELVALVRSSPSAHRLTIAHVPATVRGRGYDGTVRTVAEELAAGGQTKALALARRAIGAWVDHVIVVRIPALRQRTPTSRRARLSELRRVLERYIRNGRRRTTGLRRLATHSSSDVSNTTDVLRIAKGITSAHRVQIVPLPHR